MLWKALLYVFLLSLVYNRSQAQAFDSSLLIPESAIRNTSFKAFFLADSLSQADDSVQASVYLMRMDPYCLMFQNIAVGTLDAFFAQYKFTIHAKKEFRKKFEDIYTTLRTEPYKKFEVMFREDQSTREAFDTCRDSISHAMQLRKMIRSDSVHFDYLFNYVKKYGWPKLVDGGLYAEFIALHDGTDGHWMYYLPIMRKAVLLSQANYNMYHNILNRAITPNFEKLSRNYKEVHFDVSHILRQQPPSIAEMKVMKDVVKKNKPIKYIYFLYKSNNRKDFDRFLKIAHGLYRENMESYSIAWYLMVDLEYYQKELLSSDYQPFYDFNYEETTSAKKKLIMYLLY